MINNIKVSILIPVYNTEKYLRRCLESVVNQTLKDIEIIITNDGSRDNSERIIEEFIKNDDRISYIKQINSGLGATRNSGIEAAKGEYIAFLDSDDWVERDCYEIMYSMGKNDQADLVVTNYFIHSNKNSNIYYHEFINKEEYLKKIIERSIAGFSWNKLYKRDMIIKNKLRFPVRGELENVEDQYFSIRSIKYSNKVSLSIKPLIHYILREDSIVNRYQKNLIQDGIALYKENKLLFKNNMEYNDEVAINMIYHICQSVSNECKTDVDLDFKNRCLNIKNISNIKEVKEVLDIYNKNKSISNRITKETRATIYLLDKKMFKLLLILKYIRIKSINYRTKKIRGCRYEN